MNIKIDGSRRVLLVFGTIGFLGILIIALVSLREKSLLLASGKTTIGRIDDFGFNGGGVDSAPSYWFMVNGVKYDGLISSGMFSRHLTSYVKDTLVKTNLIVYYYTKDPSINRMLLNKEAFSEFKVDCPDSIKTILKKYFKYEKKPFDWLLPLQ